MQGWPKVNLSNITVVSVLSALREWDRLGKQGFLTHYKFNEARAHVIRFGGVSYFLRPIGAAAYAYDTAKPPPAPGNFNGTVDKKLRKRLKKLGFRIEPLHGSASSTSSASSTVQRTKKKGKTSPRSKKP
jgi:hypothetical protein